MPEGMLAPEQERDDKFQTLLNNATAARVISQTVEGTLGPKGLDIMMVDRLGDVVVSNDGVTILNLMEVTHPAARMIINAARAQQTEVGDGTTTTTIIAGALIAEGTAQVLKGVPVARIIEGIELGIKKCLEIITTCSHPVATLDDHLLYQIAVIAGRGNPELAELVRQGAKMMGRERLAADDYRLADAVIAREMAPSSVFNGVVINKEPVNREMPLKIENPIILVMDDSLAPEDLDHDAMRTEAGFQYYLQARELYESNLKKAISLGVNLVVVDRSVDDLAEDIFTQAGVMVLQRVSSREIERLCKHTGARKLKRNALNRDADYLSQYLGGAARVSVDEKLKHTVILEGRGETWATVLIGAATTEVVDERERMARDAASAIQAAFTGGVVPGGGALEVHLASQMEEVARQVGGMASYGVLCVKEALLRPFNCMAANAGFNPLEKLGDVIAAQSRQKVERISFDCDDGNLIDVIDRGIVDPAPVKSCAIKTAGEVAVAILRINTIIRMKNTALNHDNPDIFE